MKVRDNCLVFNGEIYNYLEMRSSLGPAMFRTATDTEVILHGYDAYGRDVVSELRGMFAFALWDEERRMLYCARDRFGIKPFYYTVQGRVLYFASEAKALLPFLPTIQTDPEALSQYAMMQFCLGDRTLFDGVCQLEPAHTLVIEQGAVKTRKYWEVYYATDLDHRSEYFERRTEEMLEASLDLHVRSDVGVGAYVSGGIDSSLVATMAHDRRAGGDFVGYTGRFDEGPRFDESAHARAVAQHSNFRLVERTISPNDFIESLPSVIRHLDYPVAGPGSFCQFVISQTAAESSKVVLGGQGGDEIFGGYARYLLAYFEQCILGAVDGTLKDGNFIVTYESIIPNLVSLRDYKPLIRQFWSDGLFEPMDQRYIALLDRSGGAVGYRLPAFADYDPREQFLELFNAENVLDGSYFDAMTHFDFKTLLPALLHVEDRMSMAHGLESRVPLLDHPLIEFVATVPADVKFKDGELKRLLRRIAGRRLPAAVGARKDKMGFPMPLAQWANGPAKDFVADALSTGRDRGRPFTDPQAALDLVGSEGQFGRAVWGHLSLELWQQEFHDRAAWYTRALDRATEQPLVA